MRELSNPDLRKASSLMRPTFADDSTSDQHPRNQSQSRTGDSKGRRSFLSKSWKETVTTFSQKSDLSKKDPDTVFGMKGSMSQDELRGRGRRLTVNAKMEIPEENADWEDWSGYSDRSPSLNTLKQAEENQV